MTESELDNDAAAQGIGDVVVPEGKVTLQVVRPSSATELSDASQHLRLQFEPPELREGQTRDGAASGQSVMTGKGLGDRS